MLMNGTWSLTSSRLAEGGGDGQIICLYGGEQRPFLLSLGQRMRGKDQKEKKTHRWSGFTKRKGHILNSNKSSRAFGDVTTVKKMKNDGSIFVFSGFKRPYTLKISPCHQVCMFRVGEKTVGDTFIVSDRFTTNPAPPSAQHK